MPDEVVTSAEAEAFDNEWMDILDGAEQEAEQARERVQYGKLDIAPRYLKWVEGDDGKRKPQEVQPGVYKNTAAAQRSLEVVVAVDIKEFSPDLEWEYERRVMIGSQDWHRIFKPAIEAIQGEGTMDGAHMGATLGQLRGQYVAVADVLQAATKRNPNPEYRTAKLATVFPDRDACHAEWFERYGQHRQSDDAGELAEPAGWMAEWDGFDTASEASQGRALVDEYGALEVVATDYYGVSVESVVKAYANGGLSPADIAKLYPKDAKMTPAKINKILA